jgi:hypothetical protein
VTTPPRAFAWEVVSRYGYADLVLTYPARAFDSIEDAYADVKFALASEMSLFYLLIRYQAWSLRISSFLMNKTSDLVDIHTKKGLAGSFSRLFRTGAIARRLGLEALQAKLALGFYIEVASEAVADTYAQSGVIGCLRDFVDGAMPSAENGAISNALDVVAFAENGRTKEVEIAVVSASTLLGGAAGALAAIIAK